MFPGTHAATHPAKPALIMAGSGEIQTYGELEAQSRRLAQHWWAIGLRPGDGVAVFLENHLRYLEIYWAAVRSGLYLTPVNRHLTVEEAEFIVVDSDAKALVSSHALGVAAGAVQANAPKLRSALMLDGVVDGFDSYETTLAGYPPEPLVTEPLGEMMLYSSGTTGRPKGIKRPLSGRMLRDGDTTITTLLSALFGFDSKTVYLSPAPMYHSAPLGYAVATQALGGTVIMMEQFDALSALALIERYRVTRSQWVPSMFVRMLRLPLADRQRYDLSSHQCATHTAAPCAIEVKEAMIEWWGPIIHELYSGTELNGVTRITSPDWLEHKGSVGRPVFGELHICDETGTELPSGEAGLIYFDGPTIEYHNDPEKSLGVRNALNPSWSTLGDIGYIDGQGYLFLTDRASFMIIAGGVNIYPQEIENVLISHPRVMDVAVIGVPHAEYGEEVKAIIELVDWEHDDRTVLAKELDALCRGHLASFKCPRSYDFEREFPRLPTGKLQKRLLRDRYTV